MSGATRMRSPTARSRWPPTSPTRIARERIFAAAAGLPPVRLLVNNAARFARDGFGEFSAGEFDAHMAVNVRAPLLLTEAFAAAHDGAADALVVNLLDAKLAAPNPDFLSYTLSKQALAGLTELAARALAPQGHPGQWHRAGADAALGRPERGEFRGDAARQPAGPRSRAGRCRRGAALSDRRRRR